MDINVKLSGENTETLRKPYENTETSVPDFELLPPSRHSGSYSRRFLLSLLRRSERWLEASQTSWLQLRRIRFHNLLGS